MARNIPRISAGSPQRMAINLEDFIKGWMTLLEESRIPPNAVKEAYNNMQRQDGVWGNRWGTGYYGPVTPNAATIDGAFEYVRSDLSTELIIVAGGNVYRNTDGGSWALIGGATLTAGVQCRFVEIRGNLYIVNGTDNIVRYNGTSLVSYTALTTPGAPTLVRGAGLASGAFPLYYQIVATNAVGFTPGGAETQILVNKDRDAWNLTANEYVDITFNRVTNALRYDIYMSDLSGFEVYLDSVADPGSGSTITYRDDGSVAPNDAVEVPIDNTTQGPKVSVLEISGNALWGTKDPNNPHRVYWTGTGQYQGYFSPFYGGGYIDIEKGGRERPFAVADYRDGKGTPTLIALTSDPEGVGSVWQIALETATVGDTSFIVPNAQKLVKSVGTSAPGSVVKFGDDIGFFNHRGLFSLGTKQNIINVLSTDEMSANIRPYVRDLIKAYIDKVTSYWYDAKIFISVPKEGTRNSHTVVFDTERRNWAGEWNVGVKQFLEYKDTSGNIHFLAVPANGTRMIEISENITGDLGGPISTRLATGRMPLARRNRYGWVQLTDVFVEFSNLVGTVQVAVLGAETNKDFSTIKTKAVAGTTSNAGFGSHLFGESLFSECSPAPTTYTQTSQKVHIPVNKLLNNAQLLITSNGNNVQYELLSARLEGFEVPQGPPRSWR